MVGRGGGGSIVWKTPDTALYSIYFSTLWCVEKGRDSGTGRVEKQSFVKFGMCKLSAGIFLLFHTFTVRKGR